MGALEPVTTRREAETRALGRILGERLGPGDLVGLTGPLGAGKTRFVQGLCRGLGVPDTVEVTSPTFALVNTYPGRLPVYHVDLYRVSDMDEVEHTGLDDVMAEGVTLVEWIERVPELAGPEALIVRIEDAGGSERRLFLEGPRAAEVADRFRVAMISASKGESR